MDKLNAIQKTLLILKNSGEIIKTDEPFELPIYEDLEEIKNKFEYLPTLKEEEFLILIQDYALFCVKEPEWWIAQTIAYKAYRKNSNDTIFFSGEYEKRELMKYCIIWIADLQSKKVLMNNDGNIFNKIKYDITDKLWIKLLPFIEVTSKEANEIYNASKDYFLNNDITYPIHPIIIEIDMMLKFGSITREEIRKWKKKEMEMIKIILMARSEMINTSINTNNLSKTTSLSDHTQKIIEMAKSHPGLFPSEVRNEILRS